MPIQNRNTIKQWFEMGDYPTQQQFWDLIDSMLMSGEVQINDVNDLTQQLQNKADKNSMDAFIQGEKIDVGLNFSYNLLQGYLLEKIIVLPGADTALRIGLTPNGEEVAPEVDITTDGEVFDVNIYAKAARLLYFTGVPAGSSVIIFKRLVKTA